MSSFNYSSTPHDFSVVMPAQRRLFGAAPQQQPQGGYATSSASPSSFIDSSAGAVPFIHSQQQQQQQSAQSSHAAVATDGGGDIRRLRIPSSLTAASAAVPVPEGGFWGSSYRNATVASSSLSPAAAPLTLGPSEQRAASSAAVEREGSGHYSSSFSSLRRVPPPAPPQSNSQSLAAALNPTVVFPAASASYGGGRSGSASLTAHLQQQPLFFTGGGASQHQQQQQQYHSQQSSLQAPARPQPAVPQQLPPHFAVPPPAPSPFVAAPQPYQQHPQSQPQQHYHQYQQQQAPQHTYQQPQPQPQQQSFNPPPRSSSNSASMGRSGDEGGSNSNRNIAVVSDEQFDRMVAREEAARAASAQRALAEEAAAAGVGYYSAPGASPFAPSASSSAPASQQHQQQQQLGYQQQHQQSFSDPHQQQNTGMLLYSSDIYEENSRHRRPRLDNSNNSNNPHHQQHHQHFGAAAGGTIGGYPQQQRFPEPHPHTQQLQLSHPNPAAAAVPFVADEGADDGTEGPIIAEDDTDTCPRAACLLAVASCAALPEVATFTVVGNGGASVGGRGGSSDGLALLASAARALLTAVPPSPHPFQRRCAHLGADTIAAVQQWRLMDSVAPSRLDALVRLFRSKGLSDAALHFASLCTNAAFVMSRLDAAGAVARLRVRCAALAVSAVGAQAPQARTRTLRRMASRGPNADAPSDDAEGTNNGDDMAFSVASPSRRRSRPHSSVAETVLERFFRRLVARPLLPGAAQGRLVFGLALGVGEGGRGGEGVATIDLRTALEVYAPSDVAEAKAKARGQRGGGGGRGGPYQLDEDVFSSGGAYGGVDEDDDGGQLLGGADAASVLSAALTPSLLAAVEGSLHQSQVEFHRLAMGAVGRLIEETFVESPTAADGASSASSDPYTLSPSPAASFAQQQSQQQPSSTLASASPAAAAVRRLFTRLMHLHQQALSTLYGGAGGGGDFYDEATGARVMAPQTANSRLLAGEGRLGERNARVRERRRLMGVPPHAPEPLPPLLPHVVKDEDLLADATRLVLVVGGGGGYDSAAADGTVYDPSSFGGGNAALSLSAPPRPGSVLALFTLLESFPIVSLLTEEGIGAAKAQRRAARSAGRTAPFRHQQQHQQQQQQQQPIIGAEAFLDAYCDLLAEAVLLVDATITQHCAYLASAKEAAKAAEADLVGRVVAQQAHIQAEMALHGTIDAQAAEVARLQQQLQAQEQLMLKARVAAEGGIALSAYGGGVGGANNNGFSNNGSNALVVASAVPNNGGVSDSQRRKGAVTIVGRGVGGGGGYGGAMANEAPVTPRQPQPPQGILRRSGGGSGSGGRGANASTFHNDGDGYASDGGGAMNGRYRQAPPNASFQQFQRPSPPQQQQRQVQFAVPTPPQQQQQRAYPSNGSNSMIGIAGPTQQVVALNVPMGPPPSRQGPHHTPSPRALAMRGGGGNQQQQTFIIPTRVIRLLQRVGRGHRTRMRLFFAQQQQYNRGRFLRQGQHERMLAIGGGGGYRY